MGKDICDSGFSEIEDAKFWWRASAKHWKSKLRMRNFTGEHLHVIENVGCRCKICKGSIFKSQKRQDADAIVWQVGLKVSASSKKNQLSKKHLRQQINPGCRYIRSQKSKSFIIPPISITIHHKARKDYAIQRIGVGLARRSWAGVHSLFPACGLSWTKQQPTPQ